MKEQELLELPGVVSGIVLETCTSTMDIAKNRLNESTSHKGFDLVVAKHQSHGRGRQGKAWYSEQDGGLYFTLVDTTPRKLSSMKALPLFVGLMLHDVFSRCGVSSVLKWPNDILTPSPRFKKLCGILLEVSAATNDSSEFVACPLIGVGINVNQKHFPSEIPATSIFIETQKSLPFKNILSDFIGAFTKEYDEFLTSGFEHLREMYWNKSCMNMAHIKVDGKSGIACSIRSDGALEVDFDGSIEPVYSGEVMLDHDTLH